MDLRPHDHDFGRFHQRIGFDSTFESEVFTGLTCDYRCDDLPTHVELHFGEQSVVSNALDGAQKLISSADGVQNPRLAFLLCRFHDCQAINFRLRDAMMTARPSHGLNPALVNPLFNRWIADV